MRNLYLCFSLLVLLAGSCHAAEPAGCTNDDCTELEPADRITQNDGDTANKGKGFYWYHDGQQPDEQPPEEDPDTQKRYPTYKELWDMHPDKFAPLLDQRLKLAIQYPTEENVYRYLQIQDVAMRKSLAFSAVAGIVAQKHPEFSNENQYPLNVPGQKALTRAKNEELDSYLESMQDKYALIVFVQDGCAFCETQKPILDLFMNKYAWEVKYLDINKYRQLADRYSVSMTPSILVLSRDQQEAMPLSSGVISVAELRARLFRSVRYMRGEVKPEQFYTKTGTSDPLKFVAGREGEGRDE